MFVITWKNENAYDDNDEEGIAIVTDCNTPELAKIDFSHMFPNREIVDVQKASEVITYDDINRHIQENKLYV
jgi:hypothetical protein